MSNDWHSKAVQVFGYRIGGYINHNAITKLFEQIDDSLIEGSVVMLSIILNVEEAKETFPRAMDQNDDARDLELTLNSFAAAQREIGEKGQSPARTDRSNILYQKLLSALQSRQSTPNVGET